MGAAKGVQGQVGIEETVRWRCRGQEHLYFAQIFWHLADISH